MLLLKEVRRRGVGGRTARRRSYWRQVLVLGGYPVKGKLIVHSVWPVGAEEWREVEGAFETCRRR